MIRSTLVPRRSLVAGLFLLAGSAFAAAAGVAGQKLDSGLGELPHYATWTDPSGRQPMAVRVPGESLDDGLAGLPHYRHWIDKSGRDPMGRGALHVASAR